MLTSATVAFAQPHGYFVLHTFHGNDGSGPLAPTVIDREGNLYGAASNGGDLNCNPPNGCGVVFRLKAITGDVTLLHIFTGAPDGEIPQASVILDADKTVFGTTSSGGAACKPAGCGTVYRVTPSGQESVLYGFTGGTTDGVGPDGILFRDAEHNLFGTTGSGGIQNVFGTAFELKPNGSETVLHLFSQSPDGAFPSAGFVSDAAGNLYSTTALGGSQNSNCMGVGCGTIFELTPSGGSWNESIVYSFLGGSDGLQPNGNLVKDSKGNLCGVTAGGGANASCGNFGCGTIFKLTRTSSGWTESVLYNFTDSTDGANPGSLVADSHGNLYGATTSGGQFYKGTLFEFTADGTFKLLHAFTGGADGSRAQVGLAIDRPIPVIFGAATSGGDATCNSTGGCGVIFAYLP